MSFGAGVEAAMDAVKTKGKKADVIRGMRENVLRKFLGMERKFRDIGELRGRGDSKRPEPTGERPDVPFKME